LEAQAAALITVTMITATMVQGTASRGLVGDLVDRIGLAPITAGPRVGPQAVPTGEALALQVPGQPQALVEPSVAETP